jgi:hypothetical protein
VKLDWDSSLGPEDMFDTALRSGHREEEDVGRVQKDDGTCVVAAVHSQDSGDGLSG